MDYIQVWMCFLAAFINLASANKFEPSVAFACEHGAMHMHEDGKWVSDPKTDCMESKAEILAYCEKVYPALQVTNIVESTDYKHIKGWCKVGKSDCSSNDAFKVRPYRCLTGPFQSDALIVPKKCEFDHVHEPKQCHGFDWWKDVAFKACHGLKHMKTVSYAMLLPCGTDMFTGVEYVCCPDNANVTAVSDDIDDTDTASTTTSSVKIVPEAKAVDGTNKLKDAVGKYLNLKQMSYKHTEHSAYFSAKQELVKENHEKVNKLMKNWEDARKRVIKLKDVDPKGAEKMNKDITNRFEKEYFSMQTSSDSKLMQLDAVHQQHVQSNLDAKKRRSIEKLMQEMQSSEPSQNKMLKELKRYISTEEKDAQHCIKHYTKIRDRDGAQGQQLLPATISHLTLISKRINQSIDLLNSLSNVNMRKQMVTAINSWRSEKFNNLEKYISSFQKQLQVHHVVKKVDPTTPEPQKEVDSNPEKLEMVDKPTITVIERKHQPEKSKGMYKQFADKFAAKSGEAKIEKKVEIFTLEEEDEKEQEHAPKAKIVVNNMAPGVALAAQSNAHVAAVSGTQSVTSNLSVGAGVAIALGVIAVLVVVVFSIVAKNKKKGVAKPSKDSYSEVSIEDNLSAEDRHIASMQNGYENPTYKLLEARVV